MSFTKEDRQAIRSDPRFLGREYLDRAKAAIDYANDSDTDHEATQREALVAIGNALTGMLQLMEEAEAEERRRADEATAAMAGLDITPYGKLHR